MSTTLQRSQFKWGASLLTAVSVFGLLMACGGGSDATGSDGAMVSDEARMKAPADLSTGPLVNVHKNVDTPFTTNLTTPDIDPGAYIHPHAVVIGECIIGNQVMMSPTAVCRGDEGTPIRVGDRTNLQDGTILHALYKENEGEKVEGRVFSAEGERLAVDDPAWDDGYTIWIGNDVSVAHGSQVHGPAWVGNETFIGMEVMVFNAKIGNNVAIGVGATVTGGVEIPDGAYIPPGAVIDDEGDVAGLGERIGSPYEGINEAVVYVNIELSKAYAAEFTREKTAEDGHIQKNPETPFQTEIVEPKISDKAFIHPRAVVIGDCEIGDRVMMSPTAVCRGDEGTPIRVGEATNLQDNIILHALYEENEGEKVDGRVFTEDGEQLNADDPRFDDGYVIWIGDRVSVAHGSQVHGPAWVGNDTFIGMETMIFNARIGNNVAIGVGSTITNGVSIPDGKYVPPGSVIVTQDQADELGERIGSPYEGINEAVVFVNERFSESYTDDYPTTDIARNLYHSVGTVFSARGIWPMIGESATIHPFAVVLGDCILGEQVMMSPFAVCRGDEGTPIRVGNGTNLQDGIILHALYQERDGERVEGRVFSADGERLAIDDPAWEDGYVIWIGNDVSVAHGSQVHGPAWVGNDTFIGMEVMIFNAKVGNNVAIGVGSTITGGVEIPDGRYVPPGSVIDTQAEADALGPKDGSPYDGINEAVVYVNKELARAYPAEILD